MGGLGQGSSAHPLLKGIEEVGLYDDTLIIRTADGEMGLTHGGMRQKNFNFYEEAQFQRLKRKLAAVEKSRLRPLT